MNVTTQVSKDGKEVTIFVRGRFDFNAQQEFRNAYRYQDERRDCYRVNLSRAEYMDSSALGMLLLMRDFVDKIKSKLLIEQPSAQIKLILETAHFDKLFDILPAP